MVSHGAKKVNGMHWSIPDHVSREDGGEVRIINDDEVIATILEPDDIKHV